MVRKEVKRFAADDAGAVTVDWVVLTAAVVGLGFTLFTIITQQSLTVGANVMNERMVEASQYARDTGGGQEVDTGDDQDGPDAD